MPAASREPAATAARIDAVSVDALFEALYRAAQKHAVRGVRTTFELIAWEPLAVAGDEPALRQCLEPLIDALADGPPGRRLVLRAFPAQEGDTVLFEFLCEGGDPPDASAPLDRARACIRRMGGEMGVFPAEDNRFGVWFWLPQWIAITGFPLDAFPRAA